MDSRERVDKCLSHQQPDRVPIDFWASKEIRARLMKHYKVTDLEPVLQRCGLDILNPLQPEVRGLDLRAIKQEFGDRISFHGGISIQRTMPYDTPEGIRDEVRHRVDALARDGGYIFCTAHDIQADTPMENIEALFAAYSEFGIPKKMRDRLPFPDLNSPRTRP